MSGKVKITQEQADAIEFLKKQYNDVVIAKTLFTHENNWTDEMNCLNKSDTDTLLRALYIGYEVEETFEVGDWVVHIPTGIIGEISHINGNWISFFHSDEQKAVNISVNDLRHATPEEIAKEKERDWWAKHGRELWEMKRGDIILHDDNLLFVNKTDFDDYFALEASNYHLNTRLSEYHVRQCKVICFAEDRKDVDHE